MPTHDYVIDNQTAPNFRADLNSALQAIVSNNSNPSAPTVTYANMIWYDTTNKLLRMRNEADDAFITLGTLGQVANTFAAAAATNATNLTGTATSNIQSSALATGTANSTTFLRGDRTWQAVTSYTDAQARTAQAGHTSGTIGSYIVAWNTTTTNINSNGTIAGTNLRYRSTGSGAGSTFTVISNSTTTFPTSGTSTLSGTWRTMQACSGRVTLGDGRDINYNWFPSLWLRIS